MVLIFFISCNVKNQVNYYYENQAITKMATTSSFI